ncbi:competence protein ComGD [Enterococcus sp. DIV1083b]
MRFMSRESENIGTRGFSGFTLMESLLVLLISSLFLFFPVVAIEYYQRSAEVFGFCARLEKGLYTLQQSAIIDNTQTRAIYQAEPTPTVSFYGAATEPVTKIDVPPQLAMQAFPDILFSSQSGNNSSLRKIIFYWQEKKQTISYKFLFGSGRYEKIVE